MDVKELFYSTTQQASLCIDRVLDSQLTDETPCSEWDLKTLINHMVYELAWVKDMLDGKTVEEVGDKYDKDLLGKDYKEAWNKTLKVATLAAKKADLSKVVHLSYANVPAKYYITEMAGDMLIHGWDVAQTLKYSLIFDKDCAETLYQETEPKLEGFAASGLFGTPKIINANTSIQTKLLSLYGRHTPHMYNYEIAN